MRVYTFCDCLDTILNNSYNSFYLTKSEALTGGTIFTNFCDGLIDMPHDSAFGLMNTPQAYTMVKLM